MPPVRWIYIVAAVALTLLVALPIRSSRPAPPAIIDVAQSRIDANDKAEAALSRQLALPSVDATGLPVATRFAGITRSGASSYARYQLALDDVPIAGTSIIVAVRPGDEMSTTVVEPDRLTDAIAFYRENRSAFTVSLETQRNRARRLGATVMQSVQDVAYDGRRLDAGTDRVRLLELASTERSSFAIDALSGLIASTVTPLHAAYRAPSNYNGFQGNGADEGWSHLTAPESGLAFQIGATYARGRSATGHSFATGTGLVFDRDPSFAEPELRTVQRLYDGGERLDGKYARVISLMNDRDGLPTPASAPGEFVFTPVSDPETRCITEPSFCSQFDNVNAYVHVDRFGEEYWVGRLGLDIDFQITILTHTSGPGSFAQGDTIKLGWGGLFLQNNALEDEIIYHEYVHVLLRHLGFAPDVYSSVQRFALSEGYADYFALSYLNQPTFANWATRCPPRAECIGPEDSSEIRTLETSPEEWNFNFGAPSTQLKYGVCTRKHPEDLKCKTSWMTFDDRYVWGMIWGSTLWDIRGVLGADVTDQLVAASIVLTGGEVHSFTTGAGAILYADRELNGGANESVLRDIFHNRGFTPHLSTVAVEEEQPAAAESPLRVEAYPNPVVSELRFEFSAPEASPAVATIFDANGREIVRRDLGIAPGNSAAGAIDMRDLAAGMYILRLTVGEHETTRSIIKSR